MAQDWYYTVNGEQVGPVTPADLKKAVTDGTIQPSDMVWKEGMAEWVEAQTIKGLFASNGSKAEPSKSAKAAPQEEEAEEDRPKKAIRKANQDDDDYDDRDDDDDRPKKSKKGRGMSGFNAEEVRSTKMTAGLLGLFGGGLGLHKFYLGKTTPGILNLLLCCVGLGVIGTIEGVIYLTKSEEDFYKDYIIGDKGWF